MEKWTSFFPKLELNSMPVLRPTMIGRLFMTEKMEQCYHEATSDWLACKGQNYRFCKSIDKLYSQIYSKGKTLYSQNLMNLLYTSEKLSENYLDADMFLMFAEEKYNPTQFMVY